ncbi:hypothetical protein B566_EDAN011509 [Ephemera danica]|nr:hypothetical protein B566_EDAN011509 [Ephemera danica]
MYRAAAYINKTYKLRELPSPAQLLRSLNNLNITMKFVHFAIALVCAAGALAADKQQAKRRMRPEASLAIASESNLHFGGNFFKTVSDANDGNMVCSPLSAQMTLALARIGARGRTAEQMSAALNLKPSREPANLMGFKTLLSTLKQQNGNGTTIKLVNWMYLKKDTSVRPRYLKAARKGFAAQPKLVDFTDPTTVDKINSDVSNFTRGKIQNLVPQDSLNEDTEALLVNALYFKGRWRKAFEKIDTYPFWTRPGHQVVTEFLNTKGEFRLHRSAQLQAVQIPYENPALSLVLVLPSQHSSLPDLQSSLDSAGTALMLKELARATPTADTVIYLPKFKLETSLELNEPLKQMGMTDMFIEDVADFSGMIDTARRMWVSQVAQKTFIEVSEQGTEAASATYLQIQSRMFVERPEFIANRPFLFFLVLQATDTSPVVLFSGRYVTPP